MPWTDPVWGGWFSTVILLLAVGVGLLGLALKADADGHRHAARFGALPVFADHHTARQGLQECVASCADSLGKFKTREFPLELLVRGYSHSKYSFPSGFSSFDSLISHELRHLPNITKAMVDRAWCIGRDPFQGVVNWQMARGALLRESHRTGDPFEDRVKNGIALLHRALPLNASRTGDVDMVLYWADIPPDLERGRKNPDRRCHATHPFFVYQKQESQHDTSSVVFPDPGFVHWAAGRRKILSASAKLSWGEKKDRLLFRGNDAGYRRALDREWLRKQRPELFDVVKVDVNDLNGRMTREEQCRFKYLLYLPGFWGTISTRLRWLLACGSVVIMPEHDWYEFFYPLLRPFEHFVPAGNLLLTRGHDLPCILDCLRQHNETARRIAESGRRFVQEVLTEDVAERYISRLFSAYAERMGYSAPSFAWRTPNACTCPK
mmetsp:Transcript_102464/g.319247  ORF Transcript_102464/g.319247 Transcript_102464/m.319247 type:complete len:437 (-) Transcript_102464:63-1373(-)